MDDPGLQIERTELMSNAMIVRSLCGPGAFDRMLAFRDALVPYSGIRTNDLAVGYALMAQPALHGILDRIIRSPEVLGIEGDESLFRWWRIVQRDDETTLDALIGGTGTEVERIAGGIDWLITSFRRSGVSWDRLADVSRDAGVLAEEILEIARECPITILSGDPGTRDANRILQPGTIRLLREYWAQGPLSGTLRYCRGLPARWEQVALPGDSMLDVQSHRDSLRQLPGFDERDYEPGWLIGKLTAATMSLQQLDLWSGGQAGPVTLLRESVRLDQVWEAGHGIFDAFEVLHPEDCEFDLAAPPTLPSPVLPSLTAPASRASPADRLAALLGRSALLIGSRDARSPLQMETIVSGLAFTLRDRRPIEIIRVFHSPESDGVSLAVLMPAVGMMSDASQWWVFHHAYRVRDADASGSRELARLDEIAENLGACIRYWDLAGVPARRLLDLCDYRQFQHLLEQVRQQEKVASAIKGVFPELLSFILLSQAGYLPVGTSVEVSFPGLGHREFDAVGVQSASHGGDCRIVEVKGGRAYRHNLTREVEKFAESLEAARENRTILADTLGWEEEIDTVSGLFIGMARSVDIPEELRQLDLEIWDLDRFKEELRRAKLPESRINLLEESLEIWKVGGLDF